MPGNEEKDILLSVGIDVSSLNEARQQIIAAFSGLSIPVGITPSSQIIQDASRIRQEITTTLAGQPINIPTILAPSSQSNLRDNLQDITDTAGNSFEAMATKNRIAIEKDIADSGRSQAKRDGEWLKSRQQVEKEIQKSAEKRVDEISKIERGGLTAEAKFKAGQYQEEHKQQLANIKRQSNDRIAEERILAKEKQ